MPTLSGKTHRHEGKSFGLFCEAEIQGLKKDSRVSRLTQVDGVFGKARAAYTIGVYSNGHGDGLHVLCASAEGGYAEEVELLLKRKHCSIGVVHLDLDKDEEREYVALMAKPQKARANQA